MAVVKACSVPMILANGLSVMITSLFLSGVSETKMPQHYYGQSQVRISQTIQRRLLFAVVLAFACTSYFVYQLQNEIAKNQEDTFLKIAIDETVSDMRAEKKLNSRINTITVNRHVGEKGFVIVFDDKLSPLSFPAEYKEKAYDKALKDVFNLEEDTTLPLTVLGENYYCRYRTEKNYKILSMWPEDEALKTRNIALYVNTYMEILVFAVLFGMIYFLIKRVVVNQIKNVRKYYFN